ncbi:disulfide bond formation protein DsbC [Thiocapsa imhoffii]|uniref:Thiol:disulfide interchange protein n=1 Tax=Thiocapsa imhoffii TaxID=382777 RepID=A0A9X1B8C1_9GAMM|nr:DsbC family protein [Thiocapsa imhoffii]MBK1644103.1 disulfide bond formation protein DsbC [Thiocapsa imhoffii]
MTRLHCSALAGLALLLGAQPVWSSPEQTIRKALVDIVPEVQIDSISPSPVPGLYEVMIGTQLMYVTGDGRYFVDGRIVDLETREDVTEPRLAHARKALVDDLGEAQMVVFGPADAQHTVTVFTDIECGYCRKLHSEIDQYAREGIRVRYLFYPRAGAGSAAYEEAVSVWCAGDDEAQRVAMTDAKAGKQIPVKSCANPVDAHIALGREMGLRGTPAILTESGDMIPGYVDAKRLAAQLNGDSGS